MPEWRSTWRGILALVVSSLCAAHESTDAVLWMQTSAEYRALVEQVFDEAQRRLPDALAAAPRLGALENRGDAAAKPPAVILDIDEAVLDNGPWQALGIFQGRQGFDPDSWDDWVMSHSADALPGALDYVRAARDQGIEVFYVTNRTCSRPTHCPQKDATIRNLVDLGFPDVDGDRVLLKNERTGWTSEKSARRAEIAEDFRIVQIIGDDLGDFVPGAREATPETRLDMVDRFQDLFGHTWYLLPNPVYGSWKKALGPSPVDHLQPDRRELCQGPLTPIGHIQGPGFSSPCAGLTVTTQGVVTLVSTGAGGLGGYFIQDAEGDSNSATAEGIFVVDETDDAGASTGDRVRIRARVVERDGLTSLEPAGPGAVEVLGRARGLPHIPIRLPEAVDGDLERYEGMLVSIAQPMTVTGNRWLAGLGQLQLASPDDAGRHGRLYQPTHQAPPGSREARRIRDENSRRLLVLDDGRGFVPDPLPFLAEGEDNATVRVGDSVADILGVLDQGRVSRYRTGDHRVDYRVQITRPPTIERRNPRPGAPRRPAGDLRLVSANVQNFFTELGNGDCSHACGFSANAVCRGAADATEFRRQKSKLRAALVPFAADIYAFQEVQNNGFGADGAIATLTRLLGDEFSYIRAKIGRIGCDGISVGLAYRDSVRPVGPARVLETGPFDSTRPGASRAALAQVFEHRATGERLTIVVNHFKSRNAPADKAALPEGQRDHGQGYWNLRRTESAEHLVRWLEELDDQIDPDILIVGDLNAYAREDPLRTLESAGFVNLLAVRAHTYVYGGRSGLLDHALVSAELAQRASAFTWPINADEPPVMGYRMRGLTRDWFRETPYRASDHDPVIVDLDLGPSRSGIH